jgi:hypothetical protein
VLAPHSSLRALITPAGRGKGGDSTEQGGTKQGGTKQGAQRHLLATASSLKPSR